MYCSNARATAHNYALLADEEMPTTLPETPEARAKMDTLPALEDTCTCGILADKCDPDGLAHLHRMNKLFQYR